MADREGKVVPVECGDQPLSGNGRFGDGHAGGRVDERPEVDDHLGQRRNAGGMILAGA